MPLAPALQQVYYSPHTEFYAFDVHAGRGFMDYYPAMEILSEAGFMCSFPPMHSGTLQGLSTVSLFRSPCANASGGDVLTVTSDGVCQRLIVRVGLPPLFHHKW